MHISPDTYVADLAAAQPATIKVFQQFGIDFCCGGRRPIAAACAEQALNLDALLTALEGSVAGPADEGDWRDARLTDIISHIQTRFHGPLREELPRLSAMVDKVLSRHGDRHRDMLVPLARTFTGLRDDLLAHMDKEDQVLFPAVQGLERGESSATEAWASIAGPINMMEMEHADAGAALAQLRRLTNGYQPPAGACPTFQGLFHGLGQLEQDMHLHVHLENNVLFPRASALAAGVSRPRPGV